jgi:putative oxidoreductase
MRTRTSEPENTINGRDRHLYTSKNVISLVSRILLSAIFIWSGINKMLDPAGTQQYMTAKGLPLVGLLYLATVAVEVGGGLSVLLGYKARYGAIALALFLIPATLVFHTNFADQMQQIAFMKNLAIFGGLLMIVQYGAGRISLDRH